MAPELGNEDTAATKKTGHNKILQYISMHLDSTLAVLPNLIVQGQPGTSAALSADQEY